MRERPILFSAPMVCALLAGTKTQTRRPVRPQPNHLLDYKPRPVTGFTCVGTETTTGRAMFAARDMGGQPVLAFPVGRHGVRDDIACPYGAPGGGLWVRETWGTGSRPDPFEGSVEGLEYRADLAYIDEIEYLPLHRPKSIEGIDLSDYPSGWRPSIHMPRWASRIQLEVKSVRVERLQAISEADAIAEGISRVTRNHGQDPRYGVKEGEYPGEGFIFSEWQRTAIAAYRVLWESINGTGSWAANPWVWRIEFRRLGAQGNSPTCQRSACGEASGDQSAPHHSLPPTSDAHPAGLQGLDANSSDGLRGRTDHFPDAKEMIAASPNGVGGTKHG